MRALTLLYPLGGVLVNHITLDIEISKAEEPILLTLLPKVTDAREVHP